MSANLCGQYKRSEEAYRSMMFVRHAPFQFSPLLTVCGRHRVTAATQDASSTTLAKYEATSHRSLPAFSQPINGIRKPHLHHQPPCARETSQAAQAAPCARSAQTPVPLRTVFALSRQQARQRSGNRTLPGGCHRRQLGSRVRRLHRNPRESRQRWVFQGRQQ